MAIEIKMPALAPSNDEMTLVRWTKKVGDAVKTGDVLAEVETDKALVDVESTGDGILGKLYVNDGAKVKVDALIAVLVKPGEAVPQGAGTPAAPAPAPAAQSQPAAVAPTAAAASVTPVAATGGRVLASPLAKRLAAQAGLDIAALRGSGPNGRVVRHDVDAARQSGVAASAAPVVSGAAFEDIPHSAMRRTIAKRLAESKQQVPHFYLTLDCEMDALLDTRQKLNEAVPTGKISVNDFIIKAVAHAMAQVPAVNASWTDSAIRRYRDVDIAVAVATPSGLITPIVRNVAAKSLGVISNEVKALAERAKAGRLLPQEYQGGSFTISNLGMYGIREFSAIINPPQACILAIGAAEQRPVVKNGSLAVATVMSCTLSADHRVVDGAVGAEFMAAFKVAIQNPFALMF